jgi:hypothetical protein
MKILFLDHDGVICLPENFGSRRTNRMEFDDFNVKALKVLNKLLKNIPDLEIVVTSDWRLFDDLAGLSYHYKIMGVLKCPYGFTPNLSFKPNYIQLSREYVRAEEIKLYLNTSPEEIEKWVAIDDLNMSPYLNNFVQVEKATGITAKGVYEQLVEYLNY